MLTKLDLRSGMGVTVLCIVFAAVYLTIGLVRHDAWLTIAAPVIMLGYAAFLLAFRSRSESVSLLGGAKGDERQRQVMLRATSLMGNVLVLAVLAGFFWALAAGHDTVANALAILGAVGGVSFGAAVVWYSRHA